MQKWKKISSKTILKHPRITVMEDQVRLPDGVITSYVRFTDHKSAACVFAVKDGEVLLQREYSYPPDEIMWQLPAGAIEAGETPEVAARRELVEESGYVADGLVLLGSYYMDNRRSDAKMYVYFASSVTECEKAGGDPEEDIESFWVPLSSLEKDIADNKIDSFTILTGWALFAAKRKHLGL